MTTWDWVIVALPLLAVLWIGIRVQRYINGVSDFLAAGRCAGRYVLCVADGSAGMGLISVVAICEMKYASGYGLDFWANFSVLITLFMTLSGFIIYRYRETRVLTMAQFFEVRYSRRFRILAGVLAFVSGLFNYALFPAVGGRFLMYYCRLPETFHLAGMQISMFGLLMALSLGLALTIVLLGGQLTTMVTDCVQGIFGYFIYAAIVGAIFYIFTIDDIRLAVMSRPEGQSFFNPFNIDRQTGFNILFILIGLFSSVYNRTSWLGNQGYLCAASSPHEQKMAAVLGTWRTGFMALMLMVIVMGVYAYMNNPAFAAGRTAVEDELTRRIVFHSESTTMTIRNQMMVPVALRHILPSGLVGLFCALMLFLMISTDTTYLHSWGSILVQDVILPLRNRPIAPHFQLLLLRLAIAGIALFAWCFSYYFGQIDFILMFFAMTGTIFLGGAGSVIIGGLYWKRGTAAGAYAAMIVGAVCGVAGFLVQQTWETRLYPYLSTVYPAQLESFRISLGALGEWMPICNWEVAPEIFRVKFPISGQEIYMLGMLLALSSYVGVSYLTCRKPFNIERMLHRGVYNLEHRTAPDAGPQSHSFRSRARGILLGITPEYSRGDRILAWSVFLWTVWGFGLFLFQLVANVCFGRWSEETWFAWWQYYTLPVTVVYGVITSIWFVIGGTRDLKRLFTALRSLKRDESDNGMVYRKEEASEK
jgi:Na+/solute symporter